MNELKCCMRGCEERGVSEEGYKIFVCAFHLDQLVDAQRRAELMYHAVEARN